MNTPKYLLVLTIAAGFVIAHIYTRNNSERLRILIEVLEMTDTGRAITNEGRKNIVESYGCLHNDVFNYFFESRDERDIRDEEILAQFKKIMSAFPIHLLGTREDKKVIELDALFNCPRPVILTFVLVSDGGIYKLNEIKKLCELSKRVNLWGEHVFNAGHEKI